MAALSQTNIVDYVGSLNRDNLLQNVENLFENRNEIECSFGGCRFSATNLQGSIQFDTIVEKFFSFSKYFFPISQETNNKPNDKLKYSFLILQIENIYDEIDEKEGDIVEFVNHFLFKVHENKWHLRPRSYFDNFKESESTPRSSWFRFTSSECDEVFSEENFNDFYQNEYEKSLIFMDVNYDKCIKLDEQQALLKRFNNNEITHREYGRELEKLGCEVTYVVDEGMVQSAYKRIKVIIR